MRGLKPVSHRLSVNRHWLPRPSPDIRAHLWTGLRHCKLSVDLRITFPRLASTLLPYMSAQPCCGSETPSGFHLRYRQNRPTIH
ncbi:hypothetical protein ATANTOWER_023196 [Ataeniobius toweri]|uniref:Uncharacterized protein n=1 Tax=Ataeniobius toweri TaxID=208326 RepID=A0ABU7CI46_9TELE|nr:hypothetical protein [Ataeniobius toweri]